MYAQLKEIYPDLELGKYTHISSSMHLYERNFSLAKEMLDYKFNPTIFPKISSWFIDTDGNMTSNFQLLHDAIIDEEQTNHYTFSDLLFEYIYNNINN